MSRSFDLLKKRYLENIKEKPDLFVGIELEYPIVNLEGKATDGEVVKDLFRYLPSVLGFTIEKVNDFGNPIQLLDPVSQDTILFLCVVRSCQRRSGSPARQSCVWKVCYRWYEGLGIEDRKSVV